MNTEWWLVGYTIYALIDPRNNEVRYIGKTCLALETRIQNHIVQMDNDEKSLWIQELRTIQKQPIIQAIEENLTREQADQKEIYWINYFVKKGVKLSNIN